MESSLDRTLLDREKIAFQIERLLSNISELNGTVSEEVVSGEDGSADGVVKYHNTVEPAYKRPDWYEVLWIREDERLRELSARESTIRDEGRARYAALKEHPEWLQGGKEIRVMCGRDNKGIVVVVNRGTAKGMEKAWQSVMSGIQVLVEISDQNGHFFAIDPSSDK